MRRVMIFKVIEEAQQMPLTEENQIWKGWLERPEMVIKDFSMREF